MTPSTTSAPDSPERVDLLVEELSSRIGWTFADPSILLHALRHRSWCAENPGLPSNERLEFLGDSVLGLVVADHVYRNYWELPEGNLTTIRSSVVSSTTLAEVAVELELGAYVFLGKGEETSGGRKKPSILADTTEAVIGATYLDGGWDAASQLVISLLGERIELAAAGRGGLDHKTRLQELCMGRLGRLPTYDITRVGPDHGPAYTAVAVIDGRAWGSGEGRTKRQAEQAAAKEAEGAFRASFEDTDA